MALAYLNDTIRMSVTFRDWSSDGGGDPENPDTVEAIVVDQSNNSQITLTPIAGSGVGQYYVDWTPSALGHFVLQFTGTFSDTSTDVVAQDFTIVEISSDTSGSALIEDIVISFAAGLDPMYLAPEELELIFPDASLLEIAEQIQIFSNEVKTLLGLSDTDEVGYKALEYIKAAAACSLSRTYESDGSGDELTFRLGDLSVTNRNFPRSVITRGNATTWCEIATVLRRELLGGQTGLLAVVKAGKQPNPIPRRKLKRY